MKKEIISILFVIVFAAFYACKADKPALFNEADGVYFSAPSDSIALYICQISQVEQWTR